MRARKYLLLVGIVALLSASGWMALALVDSGPAMTQAAADFLASLSEAQRAQATMPFDEPRRTAWHFIPLDTRKGLQVKEMSDPQREKAHALLQAALSEVGYTKATTIMSLEAILHELEKSRANGPIRDPQRYYFTIFGQAQPDGKWGLSVEGHHLSLNFVVENDKVVSHTPAFFGANPAEVKTEIGVGPKKGTRVLAQEELLAFELLHALDEKQRHTAVIAEKAPADIRAAGDAQPPATPPEGLPAGQMNEAQQRTLRDLVQAYLDNMTPNLAAARQAEIEKAGFEKIYFAWAGADRPGIGHYYRLQGPTFLVEFVNTQPDSAGNPANHIHSVWRHLAGDFGIPR